MLHRLFLLVAFLPGLALTACVVNPVPTPSAPAAATGNVDTNARVQGAKDGGVAGGADASADANAFDHAATDATAAADAAQADVAPQVPTVLPFAPSATDPGMTPGPPHQAVRVSGPLPSGRLVLFMAGTASQPAHYGLLLAEAARMGHLVLGLSYPNGEAVGTLCGDDLACYEPVRHELLDGVDRTGKVTVKYADGIENRLIKALLWLEQNDPGHGWGNFLQSGKPQWQDIVAAGLSQGAGQAAFIGKLYPVAKVAMLSGVVDGSSKGPAFWVTNNHATPTAKYAGFAHVDDALWPRIHANWTALGMGSKGTWFDVDEAKLPYPPGTAQLTSDLPLQAPHAATGADAATPKDAGGEPRYRHAWRHLLSP